MVKFEDSLSKIDILTAYKKIQPAKAGLNFFMCWYFYIGQA